MSTRWYEQLPYPLCLATYLAARGCLLPNFRKIIQEKRQEEDKERRTWNNPGKLLLHCFQSHSQLLGIKQLASYPVGWLSIASYSYLSAQTLAYRAQISLVGCASYTVVDSQLPVQSCASQLILLLYTKVQHSSAFHFQHLLPSLLIKQIQPIRFVAASYLSISIWLQLSCIIF